MGFFNNIGNEREVLAALEEQEIRRASALFKGGLAPVRETIGSFSDFFLDRAIFCFDEKTSMKRKECGLYYVLYNISLNANSIDPELINLFFFICSSLTSGQRPSLIIDLPVDYNCAYINRQSAEGELFDKMSKDGLLAECERCPFQNLTNRGAYAFWDIVKNCFSNNPWPDWANATKEK